MQFQTNRDQPAPEAIQVGALASTDAATPARLGAGSWTILVVLFLLLIGTGFIVYLGWTLDDGSGVTRTAYVAMAAGVILSLAVGCGLMALLFYSSRNGYDEPPTLIVQDGARERRDPPPTRSRQESMRLGVSDS